MAKFFLTNKAVEDLSNIYEYTFKFWSVFQADKYYNELINYCLLLAENPKIGKNYPEIEATIFGFLANKHIIFFRIIDNQNIEVIRILGAEMDLKNRIRQ